MKNTKTIRDTKLYKQMSGYVACSIAEGFSGEESTEEELNAAWQWLVDTGLAWNLQGWYGRNAANLLENGVLLPPLKATKDAYGNVVPAGVCKIR